MARGVTRLESNGRQLQAEHLELKERAVDAQVPTVEYGDPALLLRRREPVV